jgi:ribose transport system substrate-binding protein
MPLDTTPPDDNACGANPVALWNPRLTETINCRRLYRPPPYRIGFANASTRNAWRIAMLHATVNCAKKYSRRVARFIVSDAEDDARKQSAQIEVMLRERVDLLLVSCDPAEAVDAALARAADAGVPVVVVDRRPTNDKHFLTYVSASDLALGRTTAQWLAEKIGGSGTIFMLAGMQGSSPTENRVAAAKEVFALYPRIAIAPVLYTDWQEEKGRALTKKLIAEYGVPAGVWCDSGLQGAGSMQAFIDLGVPNIPPHTGGDINRVFQLAASHGVPLAAVEYPAWMGARAVEIGLDVLAGKTLPRHIELRSQVVISRGFETPSVHPDLFVDNYVRWDRPADFVPSHGLGDSYSPDRFGS